MSKQNASRAFLLGIGLIGAVVLMTSSSLSTKAEPEPGPAIHLMRGTFDPLAGSPHLPKDLSIQAYPADVGGIYLVQFSGPVQAAWKDNLSQLGAQVFDYIPDYAFLAWLDQAAVARVTAHPHVRWVGLYQPIYRLSPDLDGSSGDQTVVVVTLPTVDETAFRRELVELGALVQDATINAFSGYFRLTVNSARLPELVHLPVVTWVEPYLQPRLLNDVARSDAILKAETIWQDLGLFGDGQIVGVCDTGLDAGVNNATMNDDFEGRIVSLYNFWPLDGADDICSGHGTHVAGSVLGNGVNSGSDPANHDYATSLAGVAPEAGLVFQAVEWALSPPDLCPLLGIPTDLNVLFQQAYDVGARIHTNSWGAQATGQYTTQSQQADEFAWDHKDFTILFAAGNDGIDTNADGVVDGDSMGAPATAKNCITVGGSENVRLTPTPNPNSGTYGLFWPADYPTFPISDDLTADVSFGMAAFSSRGPADDGRIKPDLVAPGTWVLSVYSQANHPNDGGNQNDGWGAPLNRWYKYMGGTSMATPLAAGAATLVRDYYNDIAEVASPSSALIKGTLINGAFDMTPGQYGFGSYQEISNRPDNVQGWGRIDLVNSLIPGAPREWWYDDHLTGLSTGDKITYTHSLTSPLHVISDTQPLRVSLVWTDYPGAPAANGGLVNDLDLEVIAPDGSHFYGNGMAWDRTNNVEGVDILTPTLGVYTVTVHAYNIPQETQPFALIVSGVLQEAACTAITDVELSSNSPVTLGQGMAFTATVAPLNATPPITYMWDFGAAGSGSGLDGPSPVFTYTQVGTHTVVVTAANCSGTGLVTDTLSVVVQDFCQAPQAADFDWGPRPVYVGATAFFTAGLAGGTPPFTYTWHFGDDDTQATEWAGTVSHTFSLSGTIPVTLDVANRCGEGGPIVHGVSVLTLGEEPKLFLPLIVKQP